MRTTFLAVWNLDRLFLGVVIVSIALVSISATIVIGLVIKDMLKRHKNQDKKKAE